MKNKGDRFPDVQQLFVPGGVKLEKGQSITLVGFGNETYSGEIKDFRRVPGGFNLDLDLDVDTKPSLRSKVSEIIKEQFMTGDQQANHVANLIMERVEEECRDQE